MSVMAKKKPVQNDPPEQPKPEPEKKKYPSRTRVKYLLIPVEMHEELSRIAEEEERQLSVVAKRAVREFLERLGRWPIQKRDD